MKSLFQLAAATVLGREHERLGRNNQDAYATYADEQMILAVVCDGCGSQRHSEIGAVLGSQWTIAVLQNLLRQGDGLSPQSPEFWEILQQNLLTRLQTLTADLGLPTHQAIQKYGLFTIVGCLITPTTTYLFALGDGCLIRNGMLLELGSFPGNAPPYLAYGLLPSSLDPQDLRLRVKDLCPTDALTSVVIGTDGLHDLIRSANHCLPGKSDRVGNISQFWQDDRYFKNPDFLRRRLSLINRESVQIHWEEKQIDRQPGLLPDDTTLVVIRRNPEFPPTPSQGEIKSQGGQCPLQR